MEEPKEWIKYLHLIVTVNCPLRCKMCFNWKNNEIDEIGSEYLKVVIDELYKNNYFARHAPVIFGGAEALLRRDIFDLVIFAVERGLHTVVGTSGYIYNEEISKKINDSGLHRIALPLDSLDYKKHDYLRGVDGIFQNAMRIIKEHPKKASFTCTISAYNIDEICKIAEWVENNDNIDSLGFQAIVAPYNTNAHMQREGWFADSPFSHLWPKDFSVVAKNLDKLIELCKKSTKIYTTPRHLNFFKGYFKDPNKINREAKCRIGDYTVTVMNKGDVVFCNSLSSFGNIKNKNIIDILLSAEAREAKKKMLECTATCEFYVNCFFED